MRWVKETLPPRERDRWLLSTTRLSISSLAGTARTEVAVGTVSDPSMLVTTRAAGPRSGVVSLSPVRGAGGGTTVPGRVGAAVALGSGVTAPGAG